MGDRKQTPSSRGSGHASQTNRLQGTVLEEMDLDAILVRRPKLVLVDELAHTNAPGSRHTKRYKDVEELLDGGIDVYTTLNVQHLESRVDTVAQITGSVVRETVPDSILERADDIEVVNISPDELLRRLAEGKVYTPERFEAGNRKLLPEGEPDCSPGDVASDHCRTSGSTAA